MLRRLQTTDRLLRWALCGSLLPVVFSLLPASQAPAPPGAVQPVPRAASRAWIGVWLGDAVDGGVEIVALVPGGPAERGGLVAGDIILQANQLEVTDQRTIRVALAPLAEGDALTVSVLRAGEVIERRFEVSTRVSARPAGSSLRVDRSSGRWRAAQALVRAEILELRAARITPELRRHYGAPADAGVLVIGAPAGNSLGIEVGDVVVRLGGRRIARPDQLTWYAAPSGAGSIEAEVLRGGKRLVLAAAGPEGSGPEDAGILAAAARSEREHRRLQQRLEREIERLEQRVEQLRKELSRREE